MASVMASLENITWERLLAEDAVTYPCDEPDKPGSEILFAQKIVTPSGRARIDPMGKIPKFKSSAARVGLWRRRQPPRRSEQSATVTADRRPNAQRLWP